MNLTLGTLQDKKQSTGTAMKISLIIWGKKIKPLTRNINFQLATDYILTGVCI